MRTISTSTTLSLIALTLTACGGSTKSNGRRRIAQTPIVATAAMNLPEVGWDKYQKSQYICTNGPSKDECPINDGSVMNQYPSAVVSQGQYTELINCVANDDGAYTPGNLSDNYAPNLSITSIVARIKHCCEITANTVWFITGTNQAFPMPSTSVISSNRPSISNHA